MFAGEALTREKAETLVRRYYYAGFLGLPWLWIVTFLYFRRFAGDSDVIMKYVARSFWLGIAGIVAVITWILIAQLGLAGDSALWVIRPRRGAPDGEWQAGLFSETFYQT